MIDASSAGIVRNYQNAIAPGIDSAFTKANRKDSPKPDKLPYLLGSSTPYSFKATPPPNSESMTGLKNISYFFNYKTE